MKYLFKLFLVIVIVNVNAISVSAQTAGDKLFYQGQNQQKIMTLKAQNAAIAYFKRAKLAYDSDVKKSLCDNQIKICQNTIKAAPWKKKRIVIRPNEKDVSEMDTKEPEVVQVDTTELALSASSLEFKAKGGSNTITVQCNREDWKVDTNVNWITYTTNGDNLTVTLSPNNTKGIRAGIIKVTCGKKEAQLIVTQKVKFLKGIL